VVRSMLIIGNGIGMALNSDCFSLRSGLESVWNSTEHLSREHKLLIQSAIEDTTERVPPHSEEQLDKLQVAIVATEFLSDFKIDGASWVSDPAKELPKTFRKFLHEVALYFHGSGEVLPDDFVNPLSKFINDTKTHVATLNYDNLLYDAFSSSGVLKGYDGPLIDGFWKSGFNEDHLDRYDVSKHGWYMHLHGSPLYIGNKKAMGAYRDFLDPDEDSHIVLCHVEHKPLIIGSSNILSTYWRYLEKAFEETSQLILFGYSGLDTHLNDRIRLRKDNKDLLVVEYSGAGKHADRLTFWKKQTGFSELKLKHMDNILEFNQWQGF